MFTKAFWKATAERAVATAAQSALLVVGADQLNALEADWGLVTGFAVGGAALSVLKGLAASKVKGDGPSFSAAETLTTTGGYTSGHRFAPGEDEA